MNNERYEIFSPSNSVFIRASRTALCTQSLFQPTFGPSVKYADLRSQLLVK